MPGEPPVVVVPSYRPASSASLSPGEPAGEVSTLPKVARAIAWETSEPEARARAHRQGLPMLVFAFAAWAAGSAEMDRAVWSDPNVVAVAARFVALRLDLTAAEGDAEGYAQRYGVVAVPETVVLDGEGRVVDRASGVANVERVLAALRKADE